MELYTLDGLYRRTEFIEGFESYIWTERYADIGEIQIVTPSTQQFRNLLASGTYIGSSESKRIMKIEQLEDTESDDGTKLLTVTGKEISKILYDRVVQSGFVGVAPNTWRYVGTVEETIRHIFNYGCRFGTSDPTDIIPGMTPGSTYVPGNIPMDPTTYTFERPNGPLFNAIKELADVWDMGFRLYKAGDTGNLYFEPYKGDDRTTSQSVLPAVIFSPDLDTLQNVSELISVANSKNVAHVSNQYMTVLAYAVGADATTSGLSKHMLFVDGSDINYVPRENVVSEADQQALNKAIGLKEALDYHKAAMQKIINRERLDPGQDAIIKSFTSAQVTAARLTAAERTLIDNAVDVSISLNAAETATMQAALLQKGTEELAKHRSVAAFDGEITQLSPYKYGRDYDLGDLVEMRNTDGLTNQMLVTEQIFVSDESGERAYPTLTTRLFITRGSWLAWENTQVWQDAPGTWAEA